MPELDIDLSRLPTLRGFARHADGEMYPARVVPECCQAYLRAAATTVPPVPLLGVRLARWVVLRLGRRLPVRRVLVHGRQESGRRQVNDPMSAADKIALFELCSHDIQRYTCAACQTPTERTLTADLAEARNERDDNLRIVQAYEGRAKLERERAALLTDLAEARADVRAVLDAYQIEGDETAFDVACRLDAAATRMGAQLAEARTEVERLGKHSDAYVELSGLLTHDLEQRDRTIAALWRVVDALPRCIEGYPGPECGAPGTYTDGHTYLCDEHGRHRATCFPAPWAEAIRDLAAHDAVRADESQLGDPHPRCLDCGERWAPGEGVDARRTACPTCSDINRRAHAAVGETRPMAPAPADDARGGDADARGHNRGSVAGAADCTSAKAPRYRTQREPWGPMPGADGEPLPIPRERIEAGQRLRYRRQVASMSLGDVAQALGVRVVAVSDWERGRVQIPAQYEARWPGKPAHHDRPDDDPRVCMATRADVASAIAAERERVAEAIAAGAERASASSAWQVALDKLRAAKSTTR